MIRSGKAFLLRFYSLLSRFFGLRQSVSTSRSVRFLFGCWEAGTHHKSKEICIITPSPPRGRSHLWTRWSIREEARMELRKIRKRKNGINDRSLPNTFVELITVIVSGPHGEKSTHRRSVPGDWWLVICYDAGEEFLTTHLEPGRVRLHASYAPPYGAGAADWHGLYVRKKNLNHLRRWDIHWFYELPLGGRCKWHRSVSFMSESAARGIKV